MIPNDISDYKRYLRNSIIDSKYMSAREVSKVTNIIKTQSMDKDNSINFIKNGKIKSELHRKNLQDIIINLDENIYLNVIEDYEYEKYYKYFVAYNITNYDRIKSKILNIKTNKFINQNENDYLSNIIEQPSIKEYEDSIDIKFSLIKAENPQYADGKKYPVVVTIFPNLKMLIIKYSSYMFHDLKNERTHYINTHDSTLQWLYNKLNIETKEFPCYKVFKEIRKSIKENPIIHDNKEQSFMISMIDEYGGKSRFYAKDNDQMPIIDEIAEIANSFESSNDRDKIMKFITEYEENSIVDYIGIKWKNKFSNKNGKIGDIRVLLRKIYSSSEDKGILYNFTHNHIYQNESVDRERINYVINYLSEFNAQNSIKS